MDNEASAAVTSFLKQNNIAYPLVPPHIHRRNAAERAIRTFKSHFLAGLATTNDHFQTHLWCRLVHQATIMINLLRNSRLNKKLSAYAQVFGPFNFDATPLAPPGKRIVTHEKPKERATWAARGVSGWYIGPALEHYRCYKVYITETGGERISDTAEFFPTKCNSPALTQTDRIIIAATKLTNALTDPPPPPPFHHVTNNTMSAIKNLQASSAKWHNQRTLSSLRRPQHQRPPYYFQG
jgi:hypothetical protein